MATVRADGLWKRFILRRDRADSIGQLIRRMMPSRTARPQAEPFWALQDVNFEMSPGMSVGIIGSNGSGKSTLLKLITRTMQPTLGRIEVRGKVSALIELGAGFHPDFTGRENVILNGSILGLRRRDIEHRMDSIIEFSDIRPFIDTPVKYYSSGMQARLGFSVAIHVEPEILIVDEVLAVGDAGFQRKCMDRIDEMKKQGVSILLVSHDLTAVERLMDQVLWIEHGRVQQIGAPSQTLQAYRDHLDDGVGRATDSGPASRDGAAERTDGAHDNPLKLVDAFLAMDGLRRDALDSGDVAEIVCECENAAAETAVSYLALTLRRSDGLAVAEISGMREGVPLKLEPGRSRVVVSLRDLHLTAGDYAIEATLLTPDGQHIGEQTSSRCRIRGGDGGIGVLLIPHQWTIQNGAS